MLRLPSATSAPATTSMGSAGSGNPSWATSTFANTSVSPCSASRRVSASNARFGGYSSSRSYCEEFLLGEGRLRRETVEGFPLFVDASRPEPLGERRVLLLRGD